MTRHRCPDWPVANHTPGPWSVEPDGNDQMNIYGPNRDTWIALLPHQCIASIEKEQIANAKLIAAAPVLADALAAMIARHNKNANRTARGFICGCLDCEAAETALRSAGRLP